jgi:hypothetical protein
MLGAGALVTCTDGVPVPQDTVGHKVLEEPS